MQTMTSHSASASFWDRIARKYAQQPIKDQAAYEEKLAYLRKLLKASDHVLEIGCGTGSTALRIAPNVAHITATDISPIMIEIAEAKLGTKSPGNVTFQTADAADMIASHPFDAVCAFSLLHLVDDASHAMRRIREQLKPGGLFISKTVALKNANVLWRVVLPILRLLGFAPRVVAFSTEDLHRLLKTEGFEIVETRFFGKGRMNPMIVARRTAPSDSTGR
ncbi:MAG: class I SAM-dependent methyltransferase [Pseudomonadota bacterium]